MKTQTFGVIEKITKNHSTSVGTILTTGALMGVTSGMSMAIPLFMDRFCGLRLAAPMKDDVVREYRRRRENGNDSDNPNWQFPKDGKFTWIHGVYGDGFVRGERIEIKYDEGENDKKWMREKDTNYLARIEREGALEKLEPEIFKVRKKTEPIKEEKRKEEERRREEKRLFEEKEQKREEELKKAEEENKRKEEERRRILEEERKKKKLEREKAEEQRQIEKEKKQREIKEQSEREKAPEEKTKRMVDGKNSLDLEALKPVSKSNPNNQNILSVTLPNISYNSLQLDVMNPLGEGSFGKVYKGIWCFNNVAFKELSTQNIGIKNEFIHEANMLAKMCFHPCIIKIHGICIDLNHYGIVMEFMPKGSLFSLLQNGQDLPWKVRYSIVMDITSGLHYLHDQKTTHRDLKSLNVLLDDRLRAKLCDFGSCKETMETLGSSLGSAKDARVGTHQWMAPELFEPFTKYTKSCDMYSYGMILWELVTRSIPWKSARGSNDLIEKWVTKGVREQIPKDCPKSLAVIIGDCWKSRKNRPKIANVEADLLKNQQEIESCKI